MKINDIIKVTIDGRIHNVYIAGLNRDFGLNSPIKVKFWIDWDEGPIEYNILLSDIKDGQITLS